MTHNTVKQVVLFFVVFVFLNLFLFVRGVTRCVVLTTEKKHLANLYLNVFCLLASVLLSFAQCQVTMEFS